MSAQPTTPALGATLGLDVSDRYCHFCLVDAAGAVRERGRFATTPAAARTWLGDRPTLRVVLEIGTHSPWLSRVAAECGHEVLVANARRLRLIAESDTKTDRRDAELLARVGRLDPTLLAPVTHRSLGAQQDLALVRARDALVRTRTLLVNHVRGALKSVGARVVQCSTPTFARRAREAVPEGVREALMPLLDTIERLSAEIAGYDARVEAVIATRHPEARRVRQVPGVGPLTALCFVLTLGDAARFRHSRAVGAYLGLRPRQRDSGAATPQLRISKAGDAMVRKLLVGAAQYVLGPFGPDSDLRRWGLALAARGGRSAKKRAVVATARKLAVLLHRLWVTGEAYVPVRDAARAAAA
jgi:transposase